MYIYKHMCCGMRARKSKSDLLFVAACGLQQRKGPISMLYIYVYILTGAVPQDALWANISRATRFLAGMVTFLLSRWLFFSATGFSSSFPTPARNPIEGQE